MSDLSSRASAALLAGVVVVLAGCAAPADKQAMSVEKTMAVAKQHPYAVGVTVRGGTETTATSSSNIGDADLKAAIEASIKQTQVFREVVEGRNGQYELAVNVIQLSKPAFGFSFKVDMEAGWTLSRLSDNAIVFRKAITSTYTASASDAFVGATRMRLAVEGAAKANIAQGLTAIGAIDL